MDGTFNIKVEKKSGALVDFDASKIHEAVKKSASRVLLTFTDINLKNISDEAYLKQLNGYKDYIEKRFNKPTNIYLYSVTNNTLEKI